MQLLLLFLKIGLILSWLYILIRTVGGKDSKQGHRQQNHSNHGWIKVFKKLRNSENETTH